MNRSIVFITVFAILGSVVISCSSSSSSSAGGGGASATRPSTVMGSVQSAVAKAGTSMSGTRLFSNLAGESVSRGALLVARNCDEHASPQVSSVAVSNTDAKYPGMLAYCQLSVNTGSPDSVQGAFETPKGLSCALERAGITWDGAPHTVTVTIDTNCFTQTQLDHMTGGSPMSASVTVTASSPPTNSYFDRSISMTVPGFGNYTFMTKVSATAIEFLSMEDQSSQAIGTKQGVFSGYLNLATGDLRYEARMDRMNCNQQNDCGWNRHMRIYAGMTMADGVPTGLNNVAMAYSNIQKPASGGTIVTASGDMTNGINARVWRASHAADPSQSPSDMTDYDIVSNWLETTPNTYCYTTSSDTASTCSAGPNMFSANSKFILNDGSGYTTCTNYKNDYSGMYFTSIDLDSDLPGYPPPVF